MFTTFTANREMTFEELQEIMLLMQDQETTDKIVDTRLFICGEFAEIEVSIDEDGNVTLGVKDWNAIVNLMDDEIREAVHNKFAPCSEEEFLKRYVELDSDFKQVLKSEFSMEL
jgi:hypothetical protein